MDASRTPADAAAPDAATWLTGTLPRPVDAQAHAPGAKGLQGAPRPSRLSVPDGSAEERTA
ncbi:hypothetical protein GCM10010359_52020 [Streptomyces morookaense]|nr:hypothetical protein GCM10010359_52020 [Streptomyces morookaense]